MLHLRLVSVSGVKFDDEVYEVLLPTKDGQIGMRPDHMPLISVAVSGAVVIRKNQRDADHQREVFAIGGGVIEVEHNELKIIVDEADHADSINQAEAEAAHLRAIEAKASAEDQVSLEKAQALVDRTGARLQVAGLKRRRQKH